MADSAVTVEVLTVREVARALRVTPRTVRRMVLRGELARLSPIPGSRQQYLIPRSEVERLLPSSR